MKIKAIVSAVAFTVAAFGVNSVAMSQTPAGTAATTTSAAASTPAKKQIIALVSAVGDQFTFIRQKESTGSNIIDNNIRRTVKVTNNTLNMSVLRGLDSTIAKAQPNSERIFIALNAAEMEGVLPQDREKVAIGKIVAALETMPERTTWDSIIVATPKYLQSEYSGMGPKLHGIGVYVQPIESAKIEQLDLGDGVKIDVGGSDTETGKGTFNPNDGKRNSQAFQTYIAPFSYIQVYVIDPKTMKVLEKNARHDFTKYNDPMATALDVGKSIPLDVLAPRIASLIERSAARAIGETEIGTVVTIEEQKPGAAPASATSTKK